MTESHNQFEHITGFKADAIGQPGERRFRLLVEAVDGRTAVLWLEKEQLLNLAVTLKRLMAVEEGAAEELGTETSGMATMPEPTAPDFDFQIGRMGVQYNDQQGEVVITAYSVESPEDSDLPDLSLLTDRAMANTFANDAIKLCAAGRPLCPLCGAPMGPEQHICPMHNGHGHLD
ncbi:MAG: DUF3090 family protein [Chloroflexi bacterium]|nr:DUF3090 family protein [Chloroflexota bacterium]